MPEEASREPATRDLAWIEENLRRDRDGCRAAIDRLLPEAEAGGRTADVGWLQFYQGWLAVDGDDYEGADRLFASAREIFEDLGDQLALSRIANGLGVLFTLRGVYDLALEQYQVSADMAQDLGLLEIAGTATINTAECLYDIGEYEASLAAVSRARTELAVRPLGRAAAHLAAGKSLRALGRLDEAEVELRSAVAEALDRPHDRIECRRYLAEMLLDAGRLDEAGVELSTAIATATEGGERLFLAQLQLSRARLQRMLGDHDSALADAAAALESAKELGARPLEAEALLAAFASWQMQGEYREALSAYISHAEIKDALRGEASVRSMVVHRTERVREAVKHFEGLYRQVSTISEIGRRITSNLDLEAVLADVYEAVNSIMSAPTLLIGFVDEQEQRLDFRLGVVDGVVVPAFGVRSDGGALECVSVADRSDILVEELSTDHPGRPVTIPGRAVAVGSMVIVPVIGGKTVQGVISIRSPARHSYTKKEVETVRAIGAYVAVAVENSRLFETVQSLASTDSLTGLVNRRVLTEAIAREFERFGRYGSQGSLMMVDIDHFKRVNDKHGHAAGDTVLRAVAQTLAGAVRPLDAVGRIGGEEFGLFLPETELDGAAVLAERLRGEVEGLRVALDGAGEVGVTVSVGVTSFRAEDPNWESALGRADAALYAAKNGGRNRIATEA